LAGQIRSCFIEGPAGRLEAILNSGAANPSHCALVCHPHPKFGGTMHNKVVFAAMKALNEFGFPVLRFNFRGAGLSEGAHDTGQGEKNDVGAALAWLKREFHLPIIFAGFSFGAATGLPVACHEEEVTALISIGTPVHITDRADQYDVLPRCHKPKLFVSGAADQYGPREQLERLIARAAEPRKLVLIEGADHFFDGRLQELRAVIQDWVAATLPGLPSL
jgi:alpha/beta superfamily hydrolase